MNFNVPNSALAGPQMVFTDPRMRTPSALGAYGLTFVCNNLDVALQELKRLLDAATNTNGANGQPLLTTHWFTANEGDPIAVSAQAVYDQTVNNNVVIESQASCDSYTAQVIATSSSLRQLLGGGAPSPLFPNYQPTNDTNPLPSGGVTSFLLIGGVVVASAVVLMPVIMEAVGWSKIARAKHAGYRRRKRNR